MAESSSRWQTVPMVESLSETQNSITSTILSATTTSRWALTATAVRLTRHCQLQTPIQLMGANLSTIYITDKRTNEQNQFISIEWQPIPITFARKHEKFLFCNTTKSYAISYTRASCAHIHYTAKSNHTGENDEEAKFNSNLIYNIDDRSLLVLVHVCVCVSGVWMCYLFALSIVAQMYFYRFSEAAETGTLTVHWQYTHIHAYKDSNTFADKRHIEFWQHNLLCILVTKTLSSLLSSSSLISIANTNWKRRERKQIIFVFCVCLFQSVAPTEFSFRFYW